MRASGPVDTPVLTQAQNALREAGIALPRGLTDDLYGERRVSLVGVSPAEVAQIQIELEVSLRVLRKMRRAALLAPIRSSIEALRRLELGNLAQLVSALVSVISLGLTGFGLHVAYQALHTDTVYLHTETRITPGWEAYLGPSGIMAGTADEVAQLALHETTFSELACASYIRQEGPQRQHFTVEGRAGPCNGMYDVSMVCRSDQTEGPMARCKSSGALVVPTGHCWYFLARLSEITTGWAIVNCSVEKFS